METHEDTPLLWRVGSWDYGEEEAPYVLVEFEDGTEFNLSLIDLYPESEDDIEDGFFEYDDLPALWRTLFEESAREAEKALGSDGYDESWIWEKGGSPCRWRPLADLEALHAQARTHFIDDTPRAAAQAEDDEDRPAYRARMTAEERQAWTARLVARFKSLPRDKQQAFLGLFCDDLPKPKGWEEERNET